MSSPLPQNSLGQRLNEFFFREERPLGMALVRILLPLVLLIPTLHRVYHVREFYSTEGTPTPIWNCYGQPNLLPIPSAPVAAGLYAILVMALITSSLGWRTRTSLAIAAILTAYFGMVDMISTMTKYTVVATHVLTLMAMSGCGRIWSVDRWLAVRRGRPWNELAEAWPRRLIQILIGIVYLGAAVTKMHTPAFFTGDQLRYWLLTNVNASNPVGEFLSQFPGIILVMAYVTIVWEVLFLFLGWKGIGRFTMLTLGVGFHVMTFFTLGLLVFPLIYFVLYLLWYEDADHARWLARWERWWGASLPQPTQVAFRAWRFPSVAAWAGCMLMAGAVGVWIDRNSDPFGDHRAEGRYQLVPMTEERIAQVLRNDERVEVADKIFSLDIGSVMFNDNLVDRKTLFQHGEQARVQCSLLPPHEDLFMEAHLRTESGQIVRRLWQVVPRETLRGHFWFQLDDALVPGNYSIAIRINGTEAGVRSFALSSEQNEDAVKPVQPPVATVSSR